MSTDIRKLFRKSNHRLHQPAQNRQRLRTVESLESRMLLSVGGELPAISGTVFRDVNNDEMISSGEGQPNVVVELYRDDGDGMLDPQLDERVTDPITTNEQGEYCYGDLELQTPYFVLRPAQNANGQELPEFQSSVVIFDQAEEIVVNIEDDVRQSSADLSIVKTNNVDSLIPGEQTVYTITVTNNGPSDGSRVSVIDNPPGELTDVSFTTEISGIVTGHSENGTEDIDDTIDISAGSSITYTLTGIVASSATGSLTNSAFVSAARVDTNLNNNQSTDQDSLDPQVNLRTSITNLVDKIGPGESVGYVVFVANDGPSDAVGANISVDLPPNLTNVTYSSTPTLGASGSTNGDGEVNDSVNIASGAGIAYFLNGTSADVIDKPFLAAVTATPMGQTETNMDDNSASDLDSFSSVDVEVKKTILSAEAIPGSRIQYEIEVTNLGNETVDGIGLTDVFPSDLTNVEFATTVRGTASGHSENGTGNLDETISLGLGSSIVYHVSADILSSATGELTNAATIELDRDINPANNTDSAVITLSPHADLEITKTSAASEFQIGETITYTVVATNHGPSDVQGAVVSDIVPISLENANYTSSSSGAVSGNTQSGSGSITDTVDLAAGSTVTYVLSGQVSSSASGAITNVATINAPDSVNELDASNNAATETDLVGSFLSLGSDPTVSFRDSIVGDGDGDVFQWTAHLTGKMIANIHFENANGDLDFAIHDSRGHLIASSNSTDSSNEQLVVPVVSQESYFLQVIGKNGDVVNVYDLELENFAVPMATVVRVAPESDSGMLVDDSITNVLQPRILVSADLAEFVDAGIQVLSPTDPTTRITALPVDSGVAVEVTMTDNAGNTSVGFATPVGPNSSLFELTPIDPLVEDHLLIQAAVRVFDGRMTNFGPDPASGRSLLSKPLSLTIDVSRPDPASQPDLLRASDSGASDTDNVTGKMQPAFRGTAEAGAKIRLIANREGLGLSEIIGQSFANSDGRWEITTEPLIDGFHHIRAEVEDIAGNTSGLGEPIVIEVDTLPPNTPHLDLIPASDTGMMTNDNVTSENVLEFRLTTTDPNQQNHLLDQNYKYRIYLRPDAALNGQEELIYDSEEDATIPADTILDGLTSLEVLQATVTELGDGTHNFKLEVEDRAGNISHDFFLDVVVDTLTPAASIDLIDSSDSGMMNDDDVTNQMQPAFSGISEVGSQVAILANGQIVGQSLVSSDASDGNPNDGLGIWEVTVEPLIDGRYEMASQITDLAGNSTTSDPVEIWVDTRKPNIPFLDLISDSGISDTDNITSETTPTVTITAGATTDGETNEFPNDIKYRIYDRPGNGLGEVLLIDSFAAFEDFTNGGFFTEVLPELSEGDHNLKLEVEDRAGNFSDPFLLEVTIDASEPRVSMSLLEASDSGLFNNDGVTNVRSPTYVGTGTVGDQVYLFANGVFVGQTVAGSDLTDGISGNELGAWQITVGHLDDGTYEVVAQIEDTSGLSVASSELSVTIDTHPPNTPFLDLISDTGFSGTDNITSVRTPKVAVVANDTPNGSDNPFPNDIQFRIYDRDAIGNEELISDSFVTLGGLSSNGVFEITLSEFVDGVHNLKLEVEDRAGNISPDFLLEVTVDTSGPGSVDVNMLAASDSGMLDDDNVTRIDQPAFDGGATIGDRVYLYANGELVGQADVGSDVTDGKLGNGRGAWEITSEPLRDGVYAIVAIVEDAAGNSEQSTELLIEVDTMAPNTPLLDLRTSDDTGRHNDDNITSSETIVLSATTSDANATVHRQLIPGGQNLKYRIYLRPEFGTESLIFDSVTDGLFADRLDGLTANRQILTPAIAIAEGLHNLKLEVEDRAGNVSDDFLLNLLVDRRNPTCRGILHGDSDSGIAGFPATFSDRVTRNRLPVFTGESEANSVVVLTIDAAPMGTTVAIPLDGDDAFSPPNSPSDVVGNWRISPIAILDDGLHTPRLICEDIAGNRETYTIPPILVDTQGPKVDNVTQVDGTSLFSPKPASGPDPQIQSIVIHFADAPKRPGGSAVAAVVESAAGEEGNYTLVGDANGNIPIVAVNVNSVLNSGVAQTQAELVFGAPLPDDRFTLTVSDSISDLVGNRLDGESGARSPFEGNDGLRPTDPIFPTGDNIQGGEFVARFTVDSRPEIGTWAAGNIWIDTNGNFHFDPENVDFANRDIAYKLGFTSDDVFAGNFALRPNDSTDGFDKLAVYGRAEGAFRWLVDTDNDGVPNIDRVEPKQVNGLPVSGKFDGNDQNGDEVGLFDGSTWYFDTNHDFQTDLTLRSFLVGYPTVGDFDGDGFDDLATYADDTFMIDLAKGRTRGWDGKIDHKIAFGFIGVRERPVAADMNQDGVDDLGLWVPDRAGVTDRGRGEWYFLTSDGRSLLNRLSPQDDPINTNQTIDFTPIPFGHDIYARYGDEFARPVVGNFDPPTLGNRLSAPFTNLDEPLDVDGDRFVTATDVLILVNDINQFGSRQLRTPSSDQRFLDVDQDGFVTAQDVIRIVNHINNNTNRPLAALPITNGVHDRWILDVATNRDALNISEMVDKPSKGTDSIGLIAQSTDQLFSSYEKELLADDTIDNIFVSDAAREKESNTNDIFSIFEP